MLKALAMLAFLHAQSISGFHTRAVTVSDTFPQVLYVRTQREVHFKRLHMATTINFETGIVTGAFIRRNGTVYCDIVGTYDVETQCLHVDVCGVPTISCAVVD